MTTLDTLASLGLHLFPVDHPSLSVCVGRHRPDAPCNGDRGKHPVPWSWARESTSDPRRLARDFGHGPRNVGIDCGRSGLVVLDEDAPGELDRLCRDQGRELPETFTVSTGKGRHVYFRQPPGLPFTNATGALRDYRVDVRGRGGYVVGPGSQHAAGRVYSVLIEAPIAPVPSWIATLLRPPAPPPRPVTASPAGTRQDLTGIVRFVLGATEGVDRNRRLYWGALRLFERVRDGRLTEPAGVAMLRDAAAAIRLPDSEASATIASARRAVLGA